jgi:hypothetical protein
MARPRMCQARACGAVGTGAVSRLDTALAVVRTVFTARLAPLLLVVFAVVWPLAGFPWWPLVLLAVGMVLFLAAGAGYVAETVIAAQQREAGYEQTRAYSHAQLLPRSPRGVLGAVMDSVADTDTTAACALFTDTAARQLAAAWDAPDCTGAVLSWAAQVTRPDDYGLSPRLLGDVATLSPDRELATVAGCGLRWSSRSTAPNPTPARPRPAGCSCAASWASATRSSTTGPADRPGWPGPLPHHSAT